MTDKNPAAEADPAERPAPPVEAYETATHQANEARTQYDRATQIINNLAPAGHPGASIERGTEQQRIAFIRAFLAAQSAYEPIERNAHVEMKKEGRLLYTFDYADLGEIITKTRKALTDNGLLWRQPTGSRGGKVLVQSILEHVDGYYTETSWEIPESKDKKDTAGDVTYVRRYMAGPQLSISADIDADGGNARETIEDGLIVDAWLNAEKGTEAYADWFMSLSEQFRDQLASRGPALKNAADNADREISRLRRAGAQGTTKP